MRQIGHHGLRDEAQQGALRVALATLYAQPATALHRELGNLREELAGAPDEDLVLVPLLELALGACDWLAVLLNQEARRTGVDVEQVIQRLLLPAHELVGSEEDQHG